MNTDQPSSSNLRKHTSSNPLQRWLIDRFHSAVGELLRECSGTRVLEVGCGEGFALKAMSRAVGGRPVAGLDISFSALRWAHASNPGWALLCGDGGCLPFSADSFDTLVCLEVLEHLKEPAYAMAEMRRVARHHLLLSVPNEPWFQIVNLARGKNLRRLGNDEGHINHWPARRFVHYVGQWGKIASWRISWPWTVVLCEVG